MPDEATIDYPLGAEQAASQREQHKTYGPLFPGKDTAKTEALGQAWRAWVDLQINEQEPTVQDKRLHWARNRHFAQGRQWISSRDGRTWREVNEDRNSVRVTLNQIGPALDFRLGLISEQRPGFKVYPLGTGVSGRKQAEAQQRVAEYYYNKRNGLRLLRSAMSSAFTDGVTFAQVYIDRAAGPTREDVELIAPDDTRYATLQALGYEKLQSGELLVPRLHDGSLGKPGDTARRLAQGDIATRIVLAHEVWFDGDAKTINGPDDRAKWCIIRRVRDLQSAKIETDNPELQAETQTLASDPVLDTSDYTRTAGYQRGLPPYPATRIQRQSGVYEYLIFIAPNQAAGLPNGLWRRIVGRKVVAGANLLPGGKIPLALFSDGSRDPELFKRPVMCDWLPDQMALNALASKLLEHSRIFGTGRMMAQSGTTLKETYSSIVGSLLEYKGPKPEFVNGIRVSGDVWKAVEFFMQQLENKTGWNGLARGQVTGSGTFSDVSGRALLGAREMFERAFGPVIRAAAEGMSDVAVLWVDYARFLFDTPRLIPIAGRPDLAKEIEAADLGEETAVYVDPETLTPLPRALRNQMLFDLYEKQLISAEEFRKRSPFAEIRNVHMGDTEQWERAQLVNTVLEERWEELAADTQGRYEYGSGVAVLWQDVPSVHKAALLELALDEYKPAALRELAMERWGLYDQLERAQMIDPNTGMPMAAPPGVVKGMPADLAAQFGLPAGPAAEAPDGLMQPAQQYGGEMPGAGYQAASPAPMLSPVGVPEATQQVAQPLGAWGSVEAQAMQES